MDKRWLVEIKDGETSVVEWVKKDRFAAAPNGTKAKHYRRLSLFFDTQTIPDARYYVWAQDELGAFMEVMKIQRGERGDPFERGSIFDE